MVTPQVGQIGVFAPMYNPNLPYDYLKQGFTGYVPTVGILPVQPQSQQIPSNGPVNPALLNEFAVNMGSNQNSNLNSIQDKNSTPSFSSIPEVDFGSSKLTDSSGGSPSQRTPTQTSAKTSQSSAPEFSLEEVQARKNFCRSHRLLPNVLEVLNSCRKV